MEAHPVPQNVTNFEFHLIGDMTMKQFGYLAVGVGSAYIIFITLSGLIPLIVYPLVAILAGLGVAFAFLPIMERPLDHWVAAYFRAIFKPTIRAWKFHSSSNKDPIFYNRLNSYMSGLDRAVYREQRAGTVMPKVSILSQMAPATQSVVQAPLDSPAAPTPSIPAPVTPPSQEELKKTVELAKQAQEIQNKIVETEEVLTQLKASLNAPDANPGASAKQSQGILKELQELTKEASSVSGQITTVTHQPAAQNVRKEVVPAAKAQSQTSIVLTSTPNVINGIVTDTLNNYLEGVIVVTHDKQGLPVRALKTNKLGQFVAATPLPNGVYTLSLEKDSLIFDSISVPLDGKLLAPIVVSAKKGAVA